MMLTLAWGRGAALALCSLLTTLCSSAPSMAEPHAHGRHERTTVARRGPSAPERLPVEERRHAAIERFLRNDGIRRCWTRQLYRDPTTASRRLAVGLAVDRDGRITQVRVRDPMAPSLASCIAASSVSVAPVGQGEPFEAEGTLTLERGE